MIRTLAEFKTSIADDTIEDDGDIVQFGGQAVAAAIGGMLRDQGLSVEQPEYAQEHGWEFSARLVNGKAKAKLWFQITLIEDVLLIVEETTFNIFAKPIPFVLRDTLLKLNAQMANDERFSDVLWYTKAGYDAREPGLGAPV